MRGFLQPEDGFLSRSNDKNENKDKDLDLDIRSDRPSEAALSGDPPKASRVFEEPELLSVLQLLVERAQYITGATGTALALPYGGEMVCRASAGASAPVVGARLQVFSGLTGESISRRQLLRCDNAETDARVNLEACRALGIASIVVLPLFRQNGELRGLIELFSDHPYAFEERDLVALERMADLTLTALDLAEQHRPASALAPQAPELQQSARSASAASASERTLTGAETFAPLTTAPQPTKEPQSPADRNLASQLPENQSPEILSANPAAVPDSMRRMKKCASCGFPVSDSRTLCLDCEKLDGEEKSVHRGDFGGKALPEAESQIKPPDLDASYRGVAPNAEEFLPPFLANATPVKESWLSNPVNVLAIIVLILLVLVAVVVFR
jgi:hypothetical protein